MNEQLQSKLVEILTAIQSATGKASDFAMEQLPDIAQQYVVYGRVVHTTALLLALLTLVVFLYVALKFGFLSKKVESYGGWTDARLCAALFGGTAFAISGAVFLVQIGQASLVWFAPKVWLLKELATLVKGQ